MKRLFKVLLVLFVLLLLLAGGALYGVRSWVQSDKGAARIQAELGKALGMPLEIGSATLSWGGVRLVDVKIASEGQTFLEAPAFTTEYQLLPLLHRQVVLRKMVLESPKVVWPQNAEGKWVLPTRVKAVKVAVPSAPKAPPTEKEFQLALDTLEIKDGTVTMLDAKGARFAFAQNVEIKASLANAEDVSAEVTATKLDLLDKGPAFENVVLPFHYAGGKLAFPKCEGTLGGGTVTGSFSMEPKAPDSPFDLQLALDKVQLARAIAHPDWKIRSGQLKALLTLHNTSRGGRGTGRGEIHLTQAGVDSLEPMLRLIGETCRVPELASLNLSLQDNVSMIGQIIGLPETVSIKESNAIFQLNKKETVIEDLLVDGGEFAVRVKGNISDDGKLNLDANLSVSGAMEKKISGFVKPSLTTTDSDGRHGIAFNITGKNNHPKTNLSEKVLGQQIPSQFTDLVKSILKPNDDKKKKDDEKKKDKDKDKDKGMTDAEKKEKKDKKAKEKKEKEDELAKGASPDANPIPTPAAPATPAQTPPAPAETAPAPKTAPATEPTAN